MNAGNFKLINLMSYPLIVILISSCSEENNITEPVVDSSGACTKYNFNIAPNNFPITSCGTPGPLTVDVMNKMNDFWGSGVEACSVPGINNGLVQDLDPARIYYDPLLLGSWAAYYNTPLPSNIFLAHEYGHAIQNGLLLTNPYKELQADCLAGYYMGFESCEGNISEADLIATYTNFCSIGDTATSTVWWDTSVHGTCAQRISNIQQGFNGYNQGLLVGAACP